MMLDRSSLRRGLVSTLIFALPALALADAAPPALDEHLQPLAPLVGKTWRGELTAPGSDEPKIDVSDCEVTERDERWFLEIASEVLDAILAGAFFPNPSWMCRRCEYRSTCRY